MKTPFVAVAVFVALILGAGLGWFLANDNQETATPTAKKDLPDLRKESLKLTAELHREIDDKKGEIKVQKARIKTLEDQAKASPETEDWEGKYTATQAELVKAESEIDDLKAKLEAAEKSEVEPKTESTMYVDWGKYSEIEGFAKADWKGLGETYTKMQRLLGKIRTDVLAGKQPSAEDSAEIQKLNKGLQLHAVTFIGKVPTYFPGNGEFTHPVNLVNTLAGQLEAAGEPLTADQLVSLKALAEEYDDKWEKKDASFTEETWLMVKRQAESELKEWFKAGMFKVTTQTQKEIALPTSVEDVVKLDLYSTGLNWMFLTRPLNRSSEEILKKAMKAELVELTKLTEEQLDSADYIIDVWYQTLQNQLGPYSDEELPWMNTRDILTALDAHLVMLNSLHDDIAVTDEERKSIAAQQVVILPRLKKTD